MGSQQSRQQTRHWKEEKLSAPGSELEWQIKNASSDNIWIGVGQEEGTHIWRIEKFKVTPWPRDKYGKFHEEDSYIVLHSHKKHEKTQVLLHEIHFWIGKRATADKYGTAAYKSVELYNHLDAYGTGRQHREVQGGESRLFKSYFSEITVLPGGTESGFKKVQPVRYKHRLLRFKGEKKNIRVKEVSLKWSSLNSGDVFVLDLGLHIVQWNGKDSNKDERHQAGAYVRGVKSDRSGKPVVETIDEGSTTTETASRTFRRILPPGTREIKSAEMGGADSVIKRFEKRLYRISSKRNGIKFKKVAKGSFNKQFLDQEYSYVLDTGFHVFYWVGSKADHIRGKGFARAKEYIKRSEHPFLPLTALDHNHQNSEFDEAFDK